MRIFLAGATGVIGVRLVPRLVAAGHAVAGMTRTAVKADAVRAAGAVPVVCDVFDREALIAAVVAFAPDLVMHQVTDLPDGHVREIERFLASNRRVRSEGTRNLLDAAAGCGARVLAQSVAWTVPGIEDHDNAVLAAGGTVLRYGSSGTRRVQRAGAAAGAADRRRRGRRADHGFSGRATGQLHDCRRDRRRLSLSVSRPRPLRSPASRPDRAARSTPTVDDTRCNPSCLARFRAFGSSYSRATRCAARRGW